jgi:hypothetical protein
MPDKRSRRILLINKARVTSADFRLVFARQVLGIYFPEGPLTSDRRMSNYRRQANAVSLAALRI